MASTSVSAVGPLIRKRRGCTGKLKMRTLPLVFAFLLFVGCQEEPFSPPGDLPPIEEPPIEEPSKSWSIEFFLPTHPNDSTLNRDTVYIFPANGFGPGECNYAWPTPPYEIAKIIRDNGDCHVFRWMTLVPSPGGRSVIVSDSINSDVWREFRITHYPWHVWTVVFDGDDRYGYLCFRARIGMLPSGYKHRIPGFFEYTSGGINTSCNVELVDWRSR